MRTWHLAEYLHISNHCPDCSCHLQAANPADNKQQKGEKPHPMDGPHNNTLTHTHALLHTPWKGALCVCCLPAQFVSNLICILTTFCVWLKQRGARGGEEERTGLNSKKIPDSGQQKAWLQHAPSAWNAKITTQQQQQSNRATCHSANCKLESKAESAWSPRPATLAAGAARKLCTN